MRLWLGLDLETTGLDINNDEVVEIGAVLMDVETFKPVEIYNKFVIPSKAITPEAAKVNGLSMDIITQFGSLKHYALEKVQEMSESAEYIVAHNGNNFDKPLIEAEYKRLDANFGIDKPWIDTSVDVDYPENIKTRKLAHLAAEHGFVNPFSHRALFDVLTMFKVLSFYNIDEIVKNLNDIKVKLTVKLRFEETEKRELVKARGYRWDKSRTIWTKDLRESLIDTERASSPFEFSVEKI